MLFDFVFHCRQGKKKFPKSKDKIIIEESIAKHFNLYSECKLALAATEMISQIEAVRFGGCSQHWDVPNVLFGARLEMAYELLARSCCNECGPVTRSFILGLNSLSQDSSINELSINLALDFCIRFLSGNLIMPTQSNNNRVHFLAMEIGKHT